MSVRTLAWVLLSRRFDAEVLRLRVAQQLQTVVRVTQESCVKQEKRRISMADMSKHLDKAYEMKSFEELADAPVDALEGVSKGDAELLLKAFNIRTIRDLAESKFVLRAQAIVNLSRVTAAKRKAA